MNTTKKQPRYSEEFGIGRYAWLRTTEARQHAMGGHAVDIAEVGLYAGNAARLVRQDERDRGKRPGVTSVEAELKQLRRENKELKPDWPD